MNLPLITLPIILSLGLVCSAQSSRPVPAGMRHAQELEAQNERDFPPPGASRSIDAAKLQSEAAELANLAASVPPSVQNAAKGLLAKDLIQKLKQIEKLSKHLRNEIDH